MHWHIKCTDCIMSVDDDQLDLEESDELNEILSKYSQPSSNPYLWVSGSKFNIMSFKFPVYDLTNPISFRQLEYSWRTLLTQSLVGWVLDNHPIMNDSTMWWRYDEAQIIVPISIVMKLDIGSFFISLMQNLLLNAKVKKEHHWNSRTPVKSIEYVIKSEIRLLSSIHLGWFRKLSSLFLSNELYSFISCDFPNVSLPKNCPHSEEEKSVCLTDLMIEILYKHCNSQSLSQFCLNQTGKPRGINHTLSYHPEMMYLLYLHLKDVTSRTIWSEHIQSLVEFAQDRDIHSSFSLIQECWMDDNHPATIHQVITATQSQVVLNVTPDYISKRVGTRIHLQPKML